MAPTNFEKHIKEKLETRSIQPSDEAWSKLSEKLDHEQSTAPNNSKWWYGVAASIVIIIMLALFLKSPEKEAAIEMVDTPTETIENQTIDSPEELQHEMTDAHDVADKAKSDDPNTAQIVKENQTVKPQIKESKISDQQTTDLAEQSAEQPSLDEKSNDIKLEEAAKVQEVVAQIKAAHSENKTITEQEIDALLIEAQKELVLQKSYDASNNVVDANALLQEVEFELDKSFRDKVIEALGSGYVIVRDVITTRNDN